MSKFLLLALFGALGTLCRYGLVQAADRLLGSRPFGTLFVNMVGCLLFGLVFAVARDRGRIEPGTAVLLLTGFMGAFTTFSSFVADTHGLFSGGRAGLAALNVLVQNAGGLACFVLGTGVARWTMVE